MQTFPDYHWTGQGASDSQEGCKDCHKVGFKTPEEVAELLEDPGRSGASACANCHVSHAFSKEEAGEPEVCRSCHSGAETPQWETYTESRHWDIVYHGRDSGRLLGPTCQTCHMRDGEHGVRAAWGSMFVRLPWPQEQDWTLARKAIMNALQAYDPQTGSKELLDTYFSLKMIPVSQTTWKASRSSMVEVCASCHGPEYARAKLQQGDEAIRQSDLILARGIEIAAELYADGLLQPGPDDAAYPNLISNPPDDPAILQELAAMFHIHRKQAILGTFHSSKGTMAQEGLDRLKESLERIEKLAQELRQAG